VRVENQDFLIYQNAKTAFTRAAGTAGTNAHTTYGENINCLLWGLSVCSSCERHVLSVENWKIFLKDFGENFPSYSHSHFACNQARLELYSANNSLFTIIFALGSN